MNTQKRGNMSDRTQFFEAFKAGKIKFVKEAPCYCKAHIESHEDLCLFCALEFEVHIQTESRTEIDDQIMDDMEVPKKAA